MHWPQKSSRSCEQYSRVPAKDLLKPKRRFQKTSVYRTPIRVSIRNANAALTHRKRKGIIEQPIKSGGRTFRVRIDSMNSILGEVGEMNRRRKTQPTKDEKLWEKYEDAVRAIVRQHMVRFGLEAVEPESGKVAGSTGPWRIEVFGYTAGDRKTVLFEVRRIKRNVTRPQAGEFAFRIQDTESAKGYFVTPLGRKLTRGARAVAEKTKLIHHIEVSEDATPENYILRILDLIFVRASDSMAGIIGGIKDHFRILLADEKGNPVSEITPEGLKVLPPHSKEPKS